jgi:class 3 adenylate cyclase
VKHCRHRFRAQARILGETAGLTETNRILERLRSALKELAPGVLESCILLMDPEAPRYTRPLQCDLYDRPQSCIACKRDRPAVRRAISRARPVVVNRNTPIRRPDGSRVETGAEAAAPILDPAGQVMAAISLVARPGRPVEARDFLMLKDTAFTAAHLLATARRFWQATQEKLALGQELTALYPYVPQSVRRLAAGQGADQLEAPRSEREVSVLFLDIEGYTRLSHQLPAARVVELVERLFSSVVDPIHRSGGDINETAGDGLMIIFQEGEPAANAASALAAAVDIRQTAAAFAADLAPDEAGLLVNQGIASGVALLGPSRYRGASHTRMTYTASGPVTNLAARLCDLATGGDILVSGETRRLAGGLWSLHPRGAHRLKGLEKPVGVYSPLPPDRPAAELPALGEEM